MSKTDPLGLRDPANEANWELICQYCGMAWPGTATLGDVIVPHFKAQHPGRKYAFLTRWIGLGKAPQRPKVRHAK